MTTATLVHDQPRTAHRTLRSDLDSLRSRFESAIAAQPIAATATAAGFGFLLGARLARPALVLVLRVGARAAVTWAGEAIRRTALAHLDPEDPRAANTTEFNTGGSES